MTMEKKSLPTYIFNYTSRPVYLQSRSKSIKYKRVKCFKVRKIMFEIYCENLVIKK